MEIFLVFCKILRGECVEGVRYDEVILVVGLAVELGVY
jgi:hypothetical protein